MRCGDVSDGDGMMTLTLAVDSDGRVNAEMGKNACSMRNSSSRAMNSAEAAVGTAFTVVDAMVDVIFDAICYSSLVRVRTAHGVV